MITLNVNFFFAMVFGDIIQNDDDYHHRYHNHHLFALFYFTVFLSVDPSLACF